MSDQPQDQRGRPLRDLRLSITDRCNFRCTYCMPKEVFGRNFRFLPAGQLLTFEEITRLTGLFIAHGVEKVRITGGEPLLRAEVETLVGMLAKQDGLRDLTLTTNGSLLAAKAQSLRDRGLSRVTVSLDSLDDVVFREMNDVDFPVTRVIEGIDAAIRAGLAPVKINVVVKRGVNDRGIVDMARRFRGPDTILRFIEFMDVGSTNGWRLEDVVGGDEIVSRIARELPVEPVESNYRGEVARRYRYSDGSGEFGIITSVTSPFCGDCTRARLSSEGELYTCLFSARGYDLRSLLRGGKSDAEIASVIANLWRLRDDRYSEIRSDETSGLRKVEMSHIGG